jgi:hypothetical protein
MIETLQLNLEKIGAFSLAGLLSDNFLVKRKSLPAKIQIELLYVTPKTAGRCCQLIDFISNDVRWLAEHGCKVTFKY